MLFWYKSTNTDAEVAQRLRNEGGVFGMPVPAVVEQGTQFTCFTGTKVQILTQMWGGPGARYPLSQFTCFTGTKVQILTQMWGGPGARYPLSRYPLSQFTCFTCTKVQILTQMWGGPGARYPLSLTAGNLRSKDGTVYTMPESRY